MLYHGMVVDTLSKEHLIFLKEFSKNLTFIEKVILDSHINLHIAIEADCKREGE